MTAKILREDVARMAAEAATAITQEIDEGLKRPATPPPVLRDEIFCLATRSSKTGQFEVKSIALPVPLKGELRAYGNDLSQASRRLEWQFANALMGAKVCSNEEARERAHRASFSISEVHGD